ncbi:MAG TPA: serine/threonine-protein kinase [Pirellulales bacterium]|nr:serine/threonine-protein kinase [Pirellulales bacterium]
MAFDAYQEWLLIPPGEQPPHYYGLLDIALFEDDAEVIRGAADRKMAHVRAYEVGEHARLSQKLLDQLSEAKSCLLDPQKKAAYDADLRQRDRATLVAWPPTAKPQSIVSVFEAQGELALNVTIADCPSEAMLSGFGLGTLDAESSETVGRHLAVCDDCLQRVANLPQDGFIDRLRDAVTAEQKTVDYTFVDDQPAGLETTVDLLRSARSVKQRSSASVWPELTEHPDYEFLEELGRGGMGVVYLARNRMMDRLEVLKVLNKARLDRPDALERFQQEIRSAAKLNHINIVAAYSVLRTGDSLVFAMEYVDGEDLARVVERRGPLPVANAAYYAHQAALGLQHAHEKGMVHRDIKPNNLMLAIEGKRHLVKILDFGLAKATSEKTTDVGLTRSGQLLGTPNYSAPEQTRYAQHADIRADIYSLGCTLYFLLTGGPPFQEKNLYDLLVAHHRREPKPLDLVRPEAPAALATLVAKMMAKDPAQRFQRPVEVAKALGPFFKAGQTRADVGPSQPVVETPYGLRPESPGTPISPPPSPFPPPFPAPRGRGDGSTNCN